MCVCLGSGYVCLRERESSFSCVTQGPRQLGDEFWYVIFETYTKSLMIEQYLLIKLDRSVRSIDVSQLLLEQ